MPAVGVRAGNGGRRAPSAACATVAPAASLPSMEPLETVIVVVLVAISLVGTFLTSWYSMRNFTHYRREISESEREWRLHRDGLK